MLKQNFLVILGTKWVQIKKVANYKVTNPFEYYDTDLSRFSIRGHLEKLKYQNSNYDYENWKHGIKWF